MILITIIKPKKQLQNQLHNIMKVEKNVLPFIILITLMRTIRDDTVTIFI